MDEEIDKGTIINRESSYTRPRFLGVPRDDQLREDSSIEGILGGRTISDVYREDSAALSSAGYNWDDAVRALQCLAATASYSRGKELVGFNGLRAVPLGAFFQPSLPIKDAGIQGEPRDAVEEKASDINNGEFEVTGDNGLKTVINPDTLYLAEAHHLLEKGNRYALTGEQLAHIIRNFDQEAFEGDRHLQDWIRQENEKNAGPFKARPEHKEKITYADSSEVGLEIGHLGGVDLLTNNYNLAQIQYGIDEEAKILKRATLYSNKFQINCTRTEDGWEMSYTLDESTGNAVHERVRKQIPLDSPLIRVIDIGQNIVNNANMRPDRLLTDSDANFIHECITNSMDLPQTAYAMSYQGDMTVF